MKKPTITRTSGDYKGDAELERRSSQRLVGFLAGTSLSQPFPEFASIRISNIAVDFMTGEQSITIHGSTPQIVAYLERLGVIPPDVEQTS